MDRGAGRRPVGFRWGRPGDVSAVVALVESAYRGDASRRGWTTEADLLEGRRTGADEVSVALAGPGSAMVLGFMGTDLVCCCRLEPHGVSGHVDSVHVGLVAVSPGLQAGGLGRSLLAEAERRARRRWSPAALTMTVIGRRHELIAWYGRLGYAPTGEVEPFPYGDERFGVPLVDDLEFVVLRKPL